MAARDFSGTGQYLSLASGLGLGANDAVWMAGWFYLDAVTTQVLFSLGVDGSSNNRRDVVINASELQVRSVNNAGAVSAAARTGFDTSARFLWHAVIAEWGSGTSRKCTTGGTTATNTADRSLSVAPNQLRVAASHTASALIDGRLSTFAVYSGAPSAGDLLALEDGIHPALIQPASLIDAWDFGVGSPEPGRRGNLLTLTGSPTAIDGPPIIYPRGRSMVVVGSAGADTTLSAAASAAATPTAALATAIQCAGSLSATATATADISTSIALASSVSSATTATGALSTAVTCAGSLSAQATATGALTTAIQCAASVTATATATADLTAGAMSLAGSVSSTAAVTGALTTAIQAAASASATATAAGDLSTAITAAGSLTVTTTATADLGTAITCAGSLSATTTATAALTTAVTLAASITAPATATAALTTAIQMAGALSAVVTVSASLTTVSIPTYDSIRISAVRSGSAGASAVRSGSAGASAVRSGGAGASAVRSAYDT